ncbi:MAG TPA: EAL domain-containing protein [Bacillota bacterium]|nr:EAL domain-containing protein [Bacillota bacterium]HQL35288.1 EAL domain-containing protein [Bacillota bacterium]
MRDKHIYDSIFNNSHTPMLIIDCESGEIKDGNLAACRYYGYTIEELLRMKITDINTLSHEEVFEEMNKARKENRRYFRFRHRLSSGEIRDVEVYSGPLPSGYEPLLLSIIHDVHEKKEMEHMINMQESYFLSLYENSPEAIAVLDNEFKIISINKSFEKVFQYNIKEIKHQNITDVLCDEKFYDESEYFKNCIAKGEFVREDTLRKRKDGTLVNVSLLGYPITLKGEQIGVYVIYTDLSNVKEIESKKRLFSEIFRNNTVGVVITDIDGKIQWINNAFTEITGFTENEVNGKKPSILKSGIQDQEYYSNMWNSILKTGKWQGEVFNKRKDGELYQISLNIFAIRDNKGIIEHLVGMLSDITDAKQKEIKIEALTNKDSLTDLFSRDYFVNKLNNEISRRIKNKDLDRKLAIIFLDIDDFKEINDTLGHTVGDIILKEFAKRLKSSIRENDIAARFGGDEFIIMLLLAKENYEILHIANRILEEISKPFVLDSIELHITASLGIAKYPDDGSDSTVLIRNADIAMYRSKENKNRKITMFESELDEEVREYFKIKNNLRNAVTNNELFLEYQPIIDAVENKIIGAEALLRWNYEGRKVIQPMKFIPVAEKNGYMQSIGEWVMLEACMQNKLWQNKGYSPIYVSVNVSIIQLEQPKFYETVGKVLYDSQLKPEYLQLEITETIFTKNYEKIADTIRRINELGVKIAIDDFGTGYSSMGQLSRLEISKLKIDKSFIWEIHRSENKNKIVKAIISLAKSLNLDLTAEGVEASDQLDFLIENGCNIVQGYLYSKPLNSCDIEKLFQMR